MRVLPFLLILAACAPAQPDDAPANRATAVPVPIAQPTIDAVPAAAFARLTGELRCSFSSDGAIRLVGAADVGRNAGQQALVTLGRETLLLRGERPGGFDALQRGGSFGGSGVRATVTRGTARPTGHEGAAHDAILTLVPTGERPRVATGRWECGP